MDTEADNMYRFRVRVCLLQFYVGGGLPRGRPRPRRPRPLWPRLAKKHLVMHGSDFDLRLLHDFCGSGPRASSTRCWPRSSSAAAGSAWPR
jgi:ribonuclease D